MLNWDGDPSHGVVCFNLTFVDLQRFHAWPGCSSGQRADDGCWYQASLPFLLLPTSKVASHSALSVERVPVDLACAFICNQINYCNGVLCGPSGSPTVRPEHYCATRPQHSKVLTHLAVIRDELHWLPVQCRSRYKICILVQNCIVGSSAPYLQELCLPVTSVLRRQHLRSADRNYFLFLSFAPWTMDCAVSQFQDRDSGTHCLMTFDNQLETWTFFKINLERTFLFATASLALLRHMHISDEIFNRKILFSFSYIEILMKKSYILVCHP